MIDIFTEITMQEVPPGAAYFAEVVSSVAFELKEAMESCRAPLKDVPPEEWVDAAVVAVILKGKAEMC